jgi:transglutaminase-like putative cysteine protease
MRLSIDHQTGFRYATRVKSSYNEARMTPAETDDQTVWSSRITIEPAAWSFSYTDYWGTRSHDVRGARAAPSAARARTERRRNPWR